MTEPREPRSIIAAAEDAAAAGNYPSAEALLREAAALQEAMLGPLHPDLANTLNNLGVVCEITGKPADAEDCFRRAVVIATAALEPDHPFVITSRKNLREFCEARGTPVVLPLLPPAVAVKEPAPTHAVAASPPPEAQPEPEDQRPPRRRRPLRALAIGALGPAALLIVTLTMGRPWLGSGESYEPLAEILARSPLEPPTGDEPSPGAPAPVEAIAPPSTSPRGETTTADGSSTERTTGSQIASKGNAARPTVVRARLCAELEEWLCDPPDEPVTGGPLFFYTQIKTARDTTVQHRWYRDNRLFQSVKLRVEAGAAGGYRTYSRSTMNGESVGNWRVELRTEDGVLLHQERFSVR